MVQIIRSVDLHNVDALLFTIFPGCHQPHNPSHASTSGQKTDAKIPLRRSHPQTCDGPQAMDGLSIDLLAWPGGGRAIRYRASPSSSKAASALPPYTVAGPPPISTATAIVSA